MAIVLKRNNNVFIIYIAVIIKVIVILIYYFCQAQVVLLISKIMIFVKYFDFSNFFLLNFLIELLEYKMLALLTSSTSFLNTIISSIFDKLD